MSKLRILLWPFSLVYGLIVWLRNYFYDKGIFASQPGALPTLVIGNLSVGGTGKTPMVNLLLDKLSTQYNVAVLSRGYGRKTKGFVVAGTSSTSDDIGDEPLLIYKRFPTLPLAVCEDRVQGLEEIKRLFPGVQLVILDDAFQHRRLKGDINLLLSDFNMPWWKDHYIPAGTLRDHVNQEKRADLTVFTKCPDQITGKQEVEYTNQASVPGGKNPFFTRISYGQPVHFHGPKHDLNAGTKWIGIAGIAKPGYFFQHIEKEYAVSKTFSFRDHHIFSHAEVEMMASECGTFGNRSKGWLTTEKDAMRLKSMKLPEDIPMYFIPIETQFHQDHERFWSEVEAMLKSKAIK